MIKIVNFIFNKDRLWLAIVMVGCIPLVIYLLQFMAIHEADKLQDQAQQLRSIGKFEQAISISTDAVEMMSKKFGQDSTAVAGNLIVLGGLYQIQGVDAYEESQHARAQELYAQAAPLYERALEIGIKKYGPDNTRVQEIQSKLRDLASRVQEDQDAATREDADKFSKASAKTRH